MDGAVLDLTFFLFLIITFVAAALAGIAAFALVGATGWLHILTPPQTANLIVPPWWSARGATSIIALAALLWHGTAGLAQDDVNVRAGLEIWRSSGCVDCHGPFADGNRDDDDYPMGANLRTTRLDAAGIKLTISCGRPGTGMPSFDGGAYTVRACYGRPLGSAPDNLQPTPRTLSLDEIDTLVAYLQARIVGHGKVTRQECLFYYEGKADCDDFK